MKAFKSKLATRLLADPVAKADLRRFLANKSVPEGAPDTLIRDSSGAVYRARTIPTKNTAS
ncbi:hypothetical protein [Massilia endophytica]|uniref:hypothetical protein n=1 Tax=Massilia endophytica TaxID=2899220 RepID=UPI001E4DE0C2|nr:hypothetical protein [Massilia endophytica]UGQ46661.1 hypothetical protein LSQ66_23320 [Massilia endophytica]